MSTTMDKGAESKRVTNENNKIKHVHRILIYTTCYNILDGVTLTIRKIEEEILAAGHSVCILTTNSGDLKNTNLNGKHSNRQVLFLDNAIPIPFVADPNNKDLTYQIGFAISTSIQQIICHQFRPTLIHSTDPDFTNFHLIELARREQIPLMGTYHSNFCQYMDHYPGLSWSKHLLGALIRHEYNFYQALYVPTPYTRHYLCQTHQLDRATNLVLWGRGVDLQQFSPTHRSLQFRRKLGIHDDNTVVILWVGRIVPEKRPDLFAHVIRKLHADDNINYHALIIGAGPMEQELISLPHSTFLGWQDETLLSVAYASSDLFLFPSAVETFGNVTLEAAASGLPLIVDAGCSGHLVQDGINGYACKNVKEDYVRATYNLVTNHSLRTNFSKASRKSSLLLEKKKVMQTMLKHYSVITDEFHIRYKGRHENRDAQQKQPFLGGNHPHPWSFQICLYPFMLLIQILWYVISALSWIHNKTTPLEIDKQAKQTAKKNNSTINNDSNPFWLARLGDSQVSHRIAILFVKFMLFEWRMESHIRNVIESAFRNKPKQQHEKKS